MKFSLDIDGESVEMDHEQLVIKDVQLEAPESASAIFYWGSVTAMLRSKFEAAKNDYKHSKANVLVTSLRNDPKLAEWKINAVWEASDYFRKTKSVIEHWQKLYEQSSAIYEACLARSSTIQTIYKAEIGGQPFAGSLGDEKEQKQEQLRKAMRKGKSKK